MIPFVRTKTGLTVYIKGVPTSVDSNAVNFNAVLLELTSGQPDEAKLQELLDEKSALTTWSKGKLSFDGEKVLFEGVEISPSISSRIAAIVTEDGNVDSLEKFLENLYQNPSFNSVNELYGFLDANQLPITEDGQFLAYKKVRYDFKDLRSGTFDNSVGAKPSMPRNQVDDNKNVTCSHGLHVASFSYMQHYGSGGTTDMDDVIVVCKVNPKDVVSVPVDYDNAKMRTCAYEVVSVIPRGNEDPLFDGFITDSAISRVSEVLTALRGVTWLSTVKMDEEIYFDTDREYELLVCTLFTTLNVQIMGSTVEEITARFLQDRLYSFTLKDLLKFIVNHS